LDEPTRSLDPLAAARMRALIQSLAGSDPPVTILLTSHNLSEVEELCERIAIIGRGRIRALGTSKDLRATHRQTERVQLMVRGAQRETMERILESKLDRVEITEKGQALLIAFTRESEDERLDLAVRAISEAGGQILSMDSERATLLEILESYEQNEEAQEDS
jgi:ABC-2 type transport system ATP-binding protein